MRCSKILKIVFNAGLALALTLSAKGSPLAYAREITDSTGAKSNLPEKPARIVTLMPSLGELAADLVGEELTRIVGVSEFTDYPPALGKFPSIGPYYKFNLEKVVSLKPDLVLASSDGNPKDRVLHLRELGIPVVVVATENLQQVEDSIRLVGRALGAESRGNEMAQQFRLGLDRIRQRTKTRSGKKPRVLLQVGEEPLVVVGRQSFLNEAVEAVGGENVYGDAKTHYPRPNLEDILRRKPEVIVIMAMGKDTKPYERMARNWSRFTTLTAVKEKQVLLLKGDEILRPTLRFLEGVSLLERAIHKGSHGTK